MARRQRVGAERLKSVMGFVRALQWGIRDYTNYKGGDIQNMPLQNEVHGPCHRAGSSRWLRELPQLGGGGNAVPDGRIR